MGSELRDDEGMHTQGLCNFRQAFSGFRRPRWRAIWRTRRGAVAAAILGQIANQTIHYGEVCRIKELTTFAPLGDQSCSLKILQMKRQ
jgi:hypothetical protein